MTALSKILLLFACLIPLPIMAQQSGDVVWQELLEDWAEQNETEIVPDDIIEQMTLLLEQPLNLNDTNNDKLYTLPFLTDYHISAIQAYIEQNGEMVTLAELHNINGFDSLTIRLLYTFATVGPTQQNNSKTLKEMLKHGHSNMIIGSKITLPRARGYTEGIYLGDPFRHYARYSFKYSDRIIFQLAADKDAGEPLMPPDYHSYYLMLNEFGIIKRLIIGKYQLQFGQGATLWSGFAPWMSGSMPLWRYGQGIRAASAFCEYGYLNGAAATLRLHAQIELTLFYSHVLRDATAADTNTLDSSNDIGISESTIFQNLYQSGYHRTQTEIDKKRQLPETLIGAHIQWRQKRLQIGATTYATHLANPIIPTYHVYNTFAFKGQDNFNAGVDFNYRYRRLLLFGEIATSYNMTTSSFNVIPLAAVYGMQLRINANTNIAVAGRYGSTTYHNLHANTIGQNSSVQNEKGLGFFLSSRLPGYILLNASADFFHFPWMKYRIYSPSVGTDIKIKLSKDIATNTTLSLQYRYKEAQRNSDAQRYYVETTCRQQLYLNLDYQPSDHWRLLSRIALSRFNCEEHTPQNGFLVFQQMEYHSTTTRPFTLATRLALFDVSGYDARLYTYENDLQYEFSVPMLTGQGVRFFLLYRQRLNRHISFSLKYSLTHYPEDESISSGYNLINGNKRHEFKAQLHLKF